MTGILRISKESIFSDLNNPEICTLLSHQYADKFGLLEEEVIEMLEYYGISIEQNNVRQWYNGYICGETLIYNPWSIINYVNKWKDGLKSYWINSSSNTLIKQILTRGGEALKRDLKLLIEGQTITKIVDENIVFPTSVYSSIHGAACTSTSRPPEIESDVNHVFSFLLFSGYLKPVNKIIKGDETFYELGIPNTEVRLLYNKIVASWFSETIRNERMELMLKSLISGDIDTFAEIFAYYLETSVSYYKLGDNEAEKVYHAFTLGIVLWLNKDYVVTSEEPSAEPGRTSMSGLCTSTSMSPGFGRADLMLIPKDKTKTGVIIEFKKAGKVKKQTLEEAVQAAKNQIIDRKYKSKLEAHGVKRIIQLAIGFKGKECLIEEVI